MNEESYPPNIPIFISSVTCAGSFSGVSPATFIGPLPGLEAFMYEELKEEEKGD